MPRRLGRRALDPGRAVRHDRRPQGRSRDRGAAVYEITTFRAEAYTDDSRKPRRRVRRRHRGRPGAARLHRQLDGVGADRRRASRRWSTRSAARPTSLRRTLRTPLAPRSVSATTRCGCCGRPGSSPATASNRPTSSSRPSSQMAQRLEIVSAGTDPRRVRQVDRRRPSGGRVVVPRRHRSRRSVPPRTAGDAPRTRSDPPPQGRADALDRRGRERRARGRGRRHERPAIGEPFDFRLTRLAALFHDIGKPRTRGYLRGQGHDLPPPRRGRGADDQASG